MEAIEISASMGIPMAAKNDRKPGLVVNHFGFNHMALMTLIDPNSGSHKVMYVSDDDVAGDDWYLVEVGGD